MFLPLSTMSSSSSSCTSSSSTNNLYKSTLTKNLTTNDDNMNLLDKHVPEAEHGRSQQSNQTNHSNEAMAVNDLLNGRLARQSTQTNRTAQQTSNKINHQYLVISNAMRAYIESLPDKLTITEELSDYQFWKSLRTEFIATFLFVIFTTSSLSISSRQPNAYFDDQTKDINEIDYKNQILNSSMNYSEESLLKNALAVGLTVATLVQCTGHVCGCHLSIAITIGLYVSGRVSPLRLICYLLIQIMSSTLGLMAVHGLCLPVIPLTPWPSLQPSQIFGYELLATMIIVLTYLANCDQHRRDLGFKSLSIGLSYTVGHLFAFIATGACLNPAKALAISIITGQYCLHWIYWIGPLIAGFIGGLMYEYIGSIKPPAPILVAETVHSNGPDQINNNNNMNNNCCNCNCHSQISSSSQIILSSTNANTTTASELRHELNEKTNKRKTPSAAIPIRMQNSNTSSNFHHRQLTGHHHHQNPSMQTGFIVPATALTRSIEIPVTMPQPEATSSTSHLLSPSFDDCEYCHDDDDDDDDVDDDDDETEFSITTDNINHNHHQPTESATNSHDREQKSTRPMEHVNQISATVIQMPRQRY